MVATLNAREPRGSTGRETSGVEKLPELRPNDRVGGGGVLAVRWNGLHKGSNEKRPGFGDLIESPV